MELMLHPLYYNIKYVSTVDVKFVLKQLLGQVICDNNIHQISLSISSTNHTTKSKYNIDIIQSNP